MSTPTRSESLIDAIAGTVMRWQDATQKFDEAVGQLYGLSIVEMRCLSLLWPAPLPTGVIAREIGLTPPGVTSLVDRLVTRGFVTREPDPSDRRRQQVALTERSRHLTAETYLPLAEKGRALLSAFSEGELEAIARFSSEALQLQTEAADALMQRARSSGSG